MQKLNKFNKVNLKNKAKILILKKKRTNFANLYRNKAVLLKLLQNIPNFSKLRKNGKKLEEKQKHRRKLDKILQK